jgi:hypothetical protein
MMSVRKKTLKILAGFVWYTGFLALMVKSLKLFSEAYSLNSNIESLMGTLLFTFILVALKTKYIFIKTCQKNLNRIDALENPKVWEFYRVRFFLFLISMIGLGAYLSSISHGNYWFLMGIGVLDMSVGLSLFISGFIFWKL